MRCSGVRVFHSAENDSSCTSPAARRVSTSPGAMALTRMFAGPSSMARVRVIEITAALVMA